MAVPHTSAKPAGVDPPRIYYQDGGTFHPLHGDDIESITYPGKVKDFDLEAAKRAREWFKAWFPNLLLD
jgi:hypothetical protein